MPNPLHAQSPAPPSAATSRPNIVMVITDDQGYGDLGCTGNPVVETPALDRFYADAVRLTNFHVGPTCAPTRAGLLTGHYAGSTGVWHTIGGRSIVREPEWMLPEALRAAGYRTAMFGKWHLGDNYPYRPHDRGFDTVIHHPGGGIGQQPDHWGNDYFDDTYLVNNEPKEFEGYCTDVWFDEASKFIENHVEEQRNTPGDDQPFFCYLAPNAPHSPYNVPARYFEKYKGKVPPHVARFYGMIDNLDENFGRLRSTLQALGIQENTIFIFLTDNGSSLPMTDKQGFPDEGFNAGLRGGKGSPYEGGHRVPVFIRWPAGGLTGGRDVEALTANIDMMPTLMDLCGVEPRANHDFHGQSLRDELEADTAEPPGSRVIVTESQRVPTPIKWRRSCVMNGRWRLIHGHELYDVDADPGQTDDIAAQHPGVVERLRGEYEKWFAQVYADAELPVPLPIGDPDGPDTVRLNAHDWRYPEAQGDVPWNQGQVRQAVAMIGFWEIDVRRPGRYEIELRRWPREDREHAAADGDASGQPLEWNQAETDPSYRHWYTGDNALPIRGATLRIGSHRDRVELDEAAGSATFRADLPRGLSHLHARFQTPDERDVGAYYVYVDRVDD